ncbi:MULTISPECIES: DUF397 domain-containing protein [Streptomyces]|uniref:DUF397 domain-containing protein n=1 Tax=Streptomyces TaxID=1883 RepID=UPI001E51FEC2|nr:MULTISPECIES: DUF397 domain-containing protein [Streptomyces]UFQ13893.1 DUF397 domain-containing protein [Streptomyces huasconensis]WCL83491.1 DUF397 domain-containing protein [Streptomyces sp. JCM 35825]
MTAPPRHVPSSTTLQGARWRRSSRSNGMNNCVETATLDTLHSGATARLLAVRDSKNTAGPTLLFSPAPWETFVDSLR